MILRSIFLTASVIFVAACSMTSTGVQDDLKSQQEMEERVYSIGEIDQIPVLLESDVNRPSSNDIDDVVLIGFVVNSSGETLKIEALESTNESAKRLAIKIVDSWKFNPAIKEGKPVACYMKVPIKLGNDSSTVVSVDEIDAIFSKLAEKSNYTIESMESLASDSIEVILRSISDPYKGVIVRFDFANGSWIENEAKEQSIDFLIP